jgi:hypothetical protein
MRRRLTRDFGHPYIGSFEVHFSGISQASVLQVIPVEANVSGHFQRFRCLLEPISGAFLNLFLAAIS